MLQQANRQFRAGGLTTGNREVLIETGGVSRNGGGCRQCRRRRVRRASGLSAGGRGDPGRRRGTVAVCVFDGAKARLRNPPSRSASPSAPAPTPFPWRTRCCARWTLLKGTVIPADVSVSVTRNYGETAAEKSNELLLHMGIAVFSVAILIWLTLGWRESRHRRGGHSRHARAHAAGLLSVRFHAEPHHALRADLQHRHPRR